MAEECLICGERLVYLSVGESAKCEFCGMTAVTTAKCAAGHYVCDECHIGGVHEIIRLCTETDSRNPIEILERLMELPGCHMHGPEHHIMVGAALLTAHKNSGGDIELGAALRKMVERGKKVPGGICGFWGACGAAVSTGMYVSIATNATPLTERSWGLGNLMTSASLAAIGEVGGPRCCKRNSYLSVLTAVDFAAENLGVNMERSEEVKCSRTQSNNQCIGVRCPFFAK